MKHIASALALSAMLATPAFAGSHGHNPCAHNPCAHGGAVANEVIAEQRAELAHNTDGKGFGPQSPRDIDAVAGNNKRTFSQAPASTEMNLCNIHFHKNAEHKG
ncbi:MAG: delta-class carbonic anhydrase, partial [Ghiorsea sp.]